MERNEISIHEVKVYAVLRGQADWMTSKEVAAEAGVAERTARAHCLKLVRLGLIDQAEVFPAHRYRPAEKADKRNVEYTQRLTHAAKVFQIEIGPQSKPAVRAKR